MDRSRIRYNSVLGDLAWRRESGELSEVIRGRSIYIRKGNRCDFSIVRSEEIELHRYNLPRYHRRYRVDMLIKKRVVGCNVKGLFNSGRSREYSSTCCDQC